MDIEAILKQRENELNFDQGSQGNHVQTKFELEFPDGQKIKLVSNGEYECLPPILMLSGYSGDEVFKIKDDDFEFDEDDYFDFNGPIKLHCIHGSSDFVYEYEDEGHMFLGKKKYDDERFSGLNIKEDNKFVHIKGSQGKLEFKYNDEKKEFRFINGTFRMKRDGLFNLRCGY
jgi:hypothetical protein